RLGRQCLFLGEHQAKPCPRGDGLGRGCGARGDPGELRPHHHRGGDRPLRRRMEPHRRAAQGSVSAPIYLDYQATTPLAPEARGAMLPWLEAGYGNPHSPHRLGREAAAAVEHARDQVAALLDPSAGRLLFTSGATEAVNWAIKGSFANAAPARRRIVTIA